MPSNSSQLNLIRRDTAEILASCSQSIAKLSIIAVNRDLSSAHGTFTCRTPCSLHLTRGTSAVRIVRYWHVSKCRHDRRRASCRFAAFPHSGHNNSFAPSCSMNISTSSNPARTSTSQTNQGGVTPRIVAYSSLSCTIGRSYNLSRRGGLDLFPHDSRKRQN